MEELRDPSKTIEDVLVGTSCVQEALLYWMEKRDELDLGGSVESVEELKVRYRIVKSKDQMNQSRKRTKAFQLQVCLRLIMGLTVDPMPMSKLKPIKRLLEMIALYIDMESASSTSQFVAFMLNSIHATFQMHLPKTIQHLMEYFDVEVSEKEEISLKLPKVSVIVPKAVNRMEDPAQLIRQARVKRGIQRSIDLKQVSAIPGLKRPRIQMKPKTAETNSKTSLLLQRKNGPKPGEKRRQKIFIHRTPEKSELPFPPADLTTNPMKRIVFMSPPRPRRPNNK